MSAELDAKWRELVEAGRAKWSPGMLACIYRDDGSLLGSSRHGKPGPDFLPDWNDSATLGALLGQVRKRWNDPAAHLVPDGDWHVRGDLPWTQYGTGDTEAEALLAALEAAP